MRYPFHRDRLNNAKVKTTIEEGLFLFFGETMAIEPVLLPPDYQSDFINKQTQKDDVELVDSVDGDTQKTIEDLVEAFGGKIVE